MVMPRTMYRMATLWAFPVSYAAPFVLPGARTVSGFFPAACAGAELEFDFGASSLAFGASAELKLDFGASASGSGASAPAASAFGSSASGLVDACELDGLSSEADSVS